MPTIDEFRAKQKELENTEQELKHTKDELNKKTNELENAKLENEDKKTELIKELMDEVEALRKNAENYEQQIASINAELITLRENFNNINQSTREQATTETTSEQATTETTSEQATTEATSEQATTETTSEQTTTETTSEQATTETTSEQATTETTSEQTTTETTSEQATTETTSEQATTETTSETEDSTNQQTNPEEITNENPNTSSLESIKQIDIHSYDWFLLAINKLLEEVKNTRKWLSKKWLSKAWKKGIDEAKSKLKDYEKQLNGKRKAMQKLPWREISDDEILELKKIRNNLNEIRKDIGMSQRWYFSNNAGYLYNSPENARKSNKRQINDLQFNQDFQRELREWAISTIFNWNIQKTNDFLRRIAQREYNEADYQTYLRNAAIINPCLQRYGIAIPTNPRWRIETISRAPRITTDYRNLDRWEAFKQWWLAWIVDKALSNCNNLTPWQRDTWKNIAVLWWYAAWIYWLFKFLTSDQKRWKKAWITAAAIFGTQVLTWENPFSLFQKAMTWWLSWDELSSRFWNSFWDAVDWVQNSGIENGSELSWAMYSLMVFNNTATVWEVRGRSTKFKNDPQSWTQFRLAAKEKIWAKHFEKFSAVFSENFDENKRNNRLNSIGIHDGIDNNKLIYEIASYKTMNTIIINKFLSDNWVKVTDNSIKKEEFEQYKKSCNDNNQTMDIAILNNHKNDRFMPDNEATFTDRPEDKQNKEKLNNQVDQLSLDEQTKSDLKNEIQLFYDERPIKNKPNVNDFSLEIDNNLLVLKSHNWENTKINLRDKSLTWFWSTDSNNYEIKFTRTKELLDVAYLTNDILARQKNKQIVNMPPFQYKQERKWICFNDAETLSFNFDTRVLSTWRWWATSKIETLYKYPKEYAEYLSKCRIEKNKINVDSTLYPTVKKLSETWIDFFNEQEVKDLEIWLKSIKEWQKFSVWTTNWEPYKISRRFTSLSNKLVFTAVNWDDTVFQEDLSSKFPTIMQKDNQSKFENFMNDKKNGMRWSAIN